MSGTEGQTPVERIHGEIKATLEAGAKIITVQTYEAERLEGTLINICRELELGLYRWGSQSDYVEEWLEEESDGEWDPWGPDGTVLQAFNPQTAQQMKNGRPNREEHLPGTSAPEHLVHYYQHSLDMDHSILLLKNVSPYLGDDVLQGEQKKLLIDRFSAFVSHHEGEGKTIILSSPLKIIPEELEKDILHFSFPLLESDDMEDFVYELFAEWRESHQDQGQTVPEIEPATLQRMARATSGLTSQEANIAVGVCLAEMANSHRWVIQSEDIKKITSIKAEQIKKSGTLEYIQDLPTLENVGGMENLKQWLKVKSSAIDDHVDPPKGLLLLGIPGCGKSMMAKAVAASWNMPLLQLKAENIFDQYVGNSERKISNALAVAEAMAPCVLWIDEIEKLLAGSSGGGGDSGVSARMGGSLLNWLAEKSRPVFVVATANNPERLDPAYVRRGRFDERFFVDVPSSEVRWDIITKQYEKRYGEGSSTVLEERRDELIQASEHFTGAEIETAIVEAKHRKIHNRDLGPLDATQIIPCMEDMTPDALVRKDELDVIRTMWAQKSKNADK